MSKKIIWEHQSPNDSEEDNDEQKSYFDSEEEATGLMRTPFGIFRMDDSLANPYKQFNLWMGHTNFLLTEEIISAICSVRGVEVCKPLSPYRLLIAPGKAFNWSDVRSLIQERVCAPQYKKILAKLDTDVSEKILQHINAKLSNLEFWRVYVFPNMEIYSKSYGTMADYDNGKSEFANLKRDSNGILLNSD